MARKFLPVLLILSVIFLYGCADKNETLEVFQPYQKMIQLEKKTNSPDPNWSKEIKRQLIEVYGVSEITSDKLIQEGEFAQHRLEYATNQEYEKQQYPYCLKADFLVWKSNSFYAVCDVYNKKTDSMDEDIKIITEGPNEPWIEKSFKLLDVIPINQAIKITMGSRVSFLKEGAEEVGPFTLVQTFYVSCP
jgi:hypothetical protein